MSFTIGRSSHRLSNWLVSLLLSLLFSRAIVVGEESDKLSSGLAVTFTSDDGGSSDIAVFPNVWLFVENGKPPTPFLRSGKFTAVWHGFLQLELRAEYAFQAELNGDIRLEINGKVVLETKGTGAMTVPGDS